MYSTRSASALHSLAHALYEYRFPFTVKLLQVNKAKMSFPSSLTFLTVAESQHFSLL